MPWEFATPSELPFALVTNESWMSANERDELGEDLPAPITSAVCVPVDFTVGRGFTSAIIPIRATRENILSLLTGDRSRCACAGALRHAQHVLAHW